MREAATFATGLLQIILFGYYYIRSAGEYKLISNQMMILKLGRALFVKSNPPWSSIPGVTYVGHFGELSAFGQYHVADGLLGWRLGRSISMTFPWAGPAGGNEWIFSNEQGFATSGENAYYFEKPKKDNIFRVIVVGGSTVEGNGVNSPFDNLPSKISGAISEYLDRIGYRQQTLEVINAGVGGYESSQEYLYLLSDLIDYEPNLVIVYDGWNDAEDLPEYMVRNVAQGTNAMRTTTHQTNAVRVNDSFTVWGSLNHFLLSTGNALRGALFQDLSSKFATPFAVDRLLQKLFDDIYLSPGGGWSPDPTPEPPSATAFEKIASAYADNIERMIFLAKQKKFRIAVFLQPVLGADSKDYSTTEQRLLRASSPNSIRNRRMFYPPARKRLSNLARRYEKAGVTCIADISKIAFDGVKERMYEDAGHLLAAGNKRVAETILSELKRCELLPG